MLKDFDNQIRKLHQAVAIFGPLNNALRERRNNWLHLPLHPVPEGLRTETFPGGGRLSVDFEGGTFHYHHSQTGSAQFEFSDLTQRELFEALLQRMKHDESFAFREKSEGSLVDALINKVYGANPDAVARKLEEVAGNERKLTYDRNVIGEYADLQYQVFTGIARFRARLEGHMTPVVVWPEHFDVSTLWFVDPEMDDHKAHLNFGFAPYTPGQYDLPYFYAYAYPYPDDFKPFDLPEPAFWNPTGWRGVVVNYKNLSRQPDLASFIEDMCTDVFDALRPLLP